MKKILFIYLALLISLNISLNAQSSKVNNSEKLFDNLEQIFMSPIWSPDGSMIAFTSAQYNGIWIFLIKDKSINQITDEDAAGFAFTWSVDSKSILTRVARYEGIRRYNAVKIYNIESGEASQLTDYRTMMPGLPQFASGDEIVFMYGNSKLEFFDSGIQNINKINTSSKVVYIRDDKIAVEDLETKQFEIFEPVKNERVLNLQVSADGSKAAFEIIGGDMYSMNTDGTRLKNLGKGNRPKWSPDNNHIIYMIAEDDGHQILTSDIFTIQSDGSEKTNITNTKNKIEMNPSWSPDGKKIAFDILNEGAIYILEIK